MKITEIVGTNYLGTAQRLDEGFWDNLKSRVSDEMDWASGKVDRSQVAHNSDIRAFADTFLKQKIVPARTALAKRYKDQLDRLSSPTDAQKQSVMKKYQQELKKTFLVLLKQIKVPVDVTGYKGELNTLLTAFVTMMGSTVDKIQIDSETLRKPLMDMIAISLAYDFQRDTSANRDKNPSNDVSQFDGPATTQQQREKMQNELYRLDYGQELGIDGDDILKTAGMKIPVIAFYSKPGTPDERWIKMDGKWYKDAATNVNGLKIKIAVPMPSDLAKKAELKATRYYRVNTTAVKQGQSERMKWLVVKNRNPNNFDIEPRLTPMHWEAQKQKVK